MCFSPYCLQQNKYGDICIQVIPRCVNTDCAVLIAHIHRLGSGGGGGGRGKSLGELEHTTTTSGFSDPIDQDIRTKWALSWKIVVSEWRSVTAVSLNVGGGVRHIKLAKLCMCTQNTTNTTRTDARRRVCAAMVPYRWATRGTSLRELEYTHTLWFVSFGRTHGAPYRGYGYVPLRFGGTSLEEREHNNKKSGSSVE